MALLGVIPARGGSRRLERKNVRELAGKPLIAYTIESALESTVFDKLIVSTEDKEIAKIAEEYGAEVPFERPNELATDEAQITDVAKHAINHYNNKRKNFDSVGVLPPTSPLRSAEDIQEAYSSFKSKNRDFLVGVTNYRYPPTKAFVTPDGECLESYWIREGPFDDKDDKGDLFERSQEYPDFLVDCVSIYLTNIDSFLNQKTFYGEDCIGFYIPPERAIDIDDEFDFKLSELILSQ